MKEQLRTGKCIYCGQSHMVETSDVATEKECDIAATELCTCKQAKVAKDVEKAKLQSQTNIENYFEKDFPETAELLKAAVIPLHNRAIEKITIDTGYGIKGKLSVTSKGKIKVERLETKKQAIES